MLFRGCGVVSRTRDVFGESFRRPRTGRVLRLIINTDDLRHVLGFQTHETKGCQAIEVLIPECRVSSRSYNTSAPANTVAS
jgi:hypothetical protein